RHTSLLWRGVSLFRFCTGAFVVRFKNGRVWIAILLTQSLCLIVKWHCQIKPPLSFISFSKTIVNISRLRISLDVHFERCNRFIGLVVKQELISHLINEVLRYRNAVAEFL